MNNDENKNIDKVLKFFDDLDLDDLDTNDVVNKNKLIDKFYNFVKSHNDFKYFTILFKSEDKDNPSCTIRLEDINLDDKKMKTTDEFVLLLFIEGYYKYFKSCDCKVDFIARNIPNCYKDTYPLDKPIDDEVRVSFSYSDLFK